MNIQAKIQQHYKTRISETADDHMHIGGTKATACLAEKMGFESGQSVLDIGCGLGGPARMIAAAYGVHVTGIDLSPDHIAAARALSSGLSLRFDVGEGDSLPYDTAAFDAAIVLHVGMNISGKAGFFEDIARVLKPGAKLGLYDIMRLPGDGALRFPLPWAEDADTSFLESPGLYRDYLQQAGFGILEQEDRHAFALEALNRLLYESPDIVISAGRRVLLENLLENLKNELCAPCIFIAERLE